MDFSRVGWVVGGERPELLASDRYVAPIPAAELAGQVWRLDPGIVALIGRADRVVVPNTAMAEAVRRIAAGQGGIDARFAPCLVAPRWVEEIGRVLGGAA